MISFTNFLFVPANRVDRVAKALDSAADLVCMDLEDSVPAAEKDAAREVALDTLARESSPRLALRINGLMTRAGIEDLLALARSPTRPDVLFLPMVETPREVEQAVAILGEDAPRIIPLIETVRGLRNADDIGATQGVSALMFGGGDLSAELGVALAWEPLLAARSALVMSCATNRIPAIDVPFIHLDDEAGLRAECEAARALGFATKAAIHPRQIAAIVGAMRPGEAEVAEAAEAIAAFEAGGGKAIAFRGRMLEAPVIQRYRRIIASAKNADNQKT